MKLEKKSRKKKDKKKNGFGGVITYYSEKLSRNAVVHLYPWKECSTFPEMSI